MQASSVGTQAPPDTRDLAEQLGLVIRHVMTTCGRDFLQTMEELELSLTQVKALGVLTDADEELSLKELGDALGLSLPAMSRAVDGLVRRGLATRTEDAVDRRMKRVRATQEGRELTLELIQVRLAGIEEFVARLNAREQAALAKGLAPILARDEVAASAPRSLRP